MRIERELLEHDEHYGWGWKVTGQKVVARGFDLEEAKREVKVWESLIQRSRKLSDKVK